MGKDTIVGDFVNEVGGAILGVADAFVNFVGRPFGIYTHNETFSDIQISNLITPKAADKSARRAAKHSSRGNAMLYFKKYRAFQRNYKKNYSKKFLTSLGYSPSSTATTRAIIPSRVESYVETSNNYIDVDIEEAIDKYMTLSDKCVYARGQLVGYDSLTRELTDNGNTYTYVHCTEVSEISVDLKFIRYYEDSIIDYATLNYNYDASAGTVVINSETYSVGALSSVLNTSDQYETTCTHIPNGTDPQLPDEIIYTPAEYITKNYSNTLFDNEVTYIEYRVTSGEIDTAKRYFITSSNTLPIYDTAVVDVTAIIPMKENNVMVDLKAKKLERMLGRLNLSGEQLRTSLTNKDMDGAYLMTGIDLQQKDEVHSKVLFKMFDLMSTGNGNVVISISQLNMRYSFSLAKSTISGNVTDVGKYTRNDGTGTGIASTMTLRYQGSSTEYQQIVVSNFSQLYTISGQKITAYLDSTGGYTRLVIPLQILNSLKYRDWVVIYEHSLCMLAYSTETVEVKWYETAAFGSLLKIVGFVLMILPGFQGMGAFVMRMAIPLVVMWAAQQIAIMVGGSSGMFVATVVAVWAMSQMGFFDGNTVTETWLQTANTGLNVINQSIQHELEAVTSEGHSYISSIQEKIDDLKRKSEEFGDSSTTYYSFLNFSSLGRSNPLFKTIEEYVGSIVNTEALVEGSWMYDIERQINMRNQVYVG